MNPPATTVRVELPAHLRLLSGISGELALTLDAPPTLAALIDTIEARFPMLAGTIRDHHTRQRRPYLRFFACETDISHQPLEAPLPPQISSGQEPLIILGAIAGG